MSLNNYLLLFLFTKSHKEPTGLFISRHWFDCRILVLIFMFLTSCKKAVEVDQPINSITTEATFSTNATAISAISGIYSKFINTSGSARFGNGGITVYGGLSSDELTRVSINGEQLQFYSNNISTDNSLLLYQLWSPAYFAIYDANSCIDGLLQSKGLSIALKNQLIGECKFLRAFTYFYLTNLWGDIPMPVTADWNKTYLSGRTPQDQVYDQIIADLKDAQSLLAYDYSFSGKEKIRANRYAATALLARVYLYKKDWANAETQANEVIGSGVFNLNNNLNEVFLKNSPEAILQFQPDKSTFPSAVTEQYLIASAPMFLITDTLLHSFENGDLRIKPKNWIDTTRLTSSGAVLYYPYKYKVKQGTSGANLSEYYMVLRFAEQYLIRAEAKARQNKLSEAIADLDKIRQRAGLPLIANTNPGISQAALVDKILHECQVEFFAEWGHRWFDLIRTNRAGSILPQLKGSNWSITDQLYPIPLAEIRSNPNLTQNPGYN